MKAQFVLTHPTQDNLDLKNFLIRDMESAFHINFSPRNWDRVFSLLKLDDLISELQRSAHPHQSGAQFLEELFRILEVDFAISSPPALPQGPLIIVANHPTGLLETSALLMHGLNLRPDTKVLTNSLVPKVAQLTDALMPINVYSKDKRQNVVHLRMMRGHLENGGCLLMFPSGSMAKRIALKGDSKKVVQDPPWSSSFIRLALQTQAHVVAYNASFLNPWWFYHLEKVATILRSLLMPRMFLNKRGRKYDINYLNCFTPEDIEKMGTAEEAADYIRRLCNLRI
jgi:putative hemolysin